MTEDFEKVLKKVFGKPVQIKSSFRTGGGCINETQILHLTNGERVFLKYNNSAPKDFFPAEAKGLKLLSKAENGPRVPGPLGVQEGIHPKFLILEYVEESPGDKGFYERFAQALAQLHRMNDNEFGLEHDNFIGSTVQINTPEKDPVDFFREHRIRFQQTLARKSRKLPAGVDKKIDRLCEKLGDLMDTTGEKPALLHGDLWSGNYFPGPGQQPCIFDPAVYYGLREADLAMTELFGRLPQQFYDAYHNAFPLNPGYSQRKALYNLYHLLNHLNLFGGAYLSGVKQTVRQFTD